MAIGPSKFRIELEDTLSAHINNEIRRRLAAFSSEWIQLFPEFTRIVVEEVAGELFLFGRDRIAWSGNIEASAQMDFYLFRFFNMGSGREEDFKLAELYPEKIYADLATIFGKTPMRVTIGVRVFNNEFYYRESRYLVSLDSIEGLVWKKA